MFKVDKNTTIPDIADHFAEKFNLSEEDRDYIANRLGDYVGFLMVETVKKTIATMEKKFPEGIDKD